MAMDEDKLRDRILGNLKKKFSPPDETALKDMAEAIAEAVIYEITERAVVSVEVSTTGSATTQTGTGTGTIS
jgi:hypothetical protein